MTARGEHRALLRAFTAADPDAGRNDRGARSWRRNCA